MLCYRALRFRFTVMLVALISDEYPPARAGGGIGNYTKALAALLTKSEEHEVHVFCQDDILEKPSGGENIHLVRAWNPPTRAGRRLYHSALAMIGPFAYRFSWGIAVAKAMRAIEATLGRRFDVVEVPEAGGYGAIIRFGGITNPIMLRLHTCTEVLRKYGALRATKTERLIEMMERRSVAKADLITSPSRALVTESRVALRIGKRQCLIYPNPRPHQQSCAPQSCPVHHDHTVLAAGRLCHLKGTDLVIQAVGLLQRTRYPALQLILAGRSEWTPLRLSELLTTELTRGTCVTLGEVSSSRVQVEMHAATMLVQASRFENYPTTILEAFENLCPVVAADIGGIPELVRHGVTGRLFVSGSASSLAEQMAWVLENPVESRKLAARAKAWVESELSDTNALSAVTEAYVKTIKSHSAAAHP